MTGLPSFRAPLDHGADDARRQHALGVVGQHHRVGARQRRERVLDQRVPRSRRRPAAPAPSRRAADASNDARRRSAACAWSAATRSTTRCDSIRAAAASSADRSIVPASSSPMTPTNRQRAPRLAMLRATLPAPPIDHLLALDRDHRRRRLRRDARHVAIDEVVEHQVADAEDRSARPMLSRAVFRNRTCCAGLTDSGRRCRGTASRSASTPSSSEVKPAL